MSQSSARPKRKYVILVLAVLALALVCFFFRPMTKSGLDLFPELKDASAVQITYSDLQGLTTGYLEGESLEDFVDLLSRSELKRTLAGGAGTIEGYVYHVYVYQSATDAESVSLLTQFSVSDRGKLYLKGDKLFCYLVPEDVMDCFLALTA